MDPHLELARRVADRLTRVPGLVAVALGGSRARDDARPDSDADLGLYYREDAGPAVADLRAAAASLGGDPAAVTELGAWGPHVNGGAWLELDGHRQDWIYRELGRVELAVEDALAGRTRLLHQPGHPHGVSTHAYAAELALSVPLADPAGELARLRERLGGYPEPLCQSLVSAFGWQASFALDTTRKSAARGDVLHVAGSLFACAMALVEVLFALNRRWLTNEKGALEALVALPLRPPGSADEIRRVLAAPGATPEALLASLTSFEALTAETLELARSALENGGGQE